MHLQQPIFLPGGMPQVPLTLVSRAPNQPSAFPAVAFPQLLQLHCCELEKGSETSAWLGHGHELVLARASC